MAIASQLPNLELKLTHVIRKRDDLYDIMFLLELTTKVRVLTLSCVTFKTEQEAIRMASAMSNHDLTELDMSFSDTDEALVEVFVE
jgi:hypothetical protein